MAKRIISTGFWEDEKVIDHFSPEDKYFMLYLLTNPKTTTIGIYKLPKKIAAFELGYTRDTVSVLLDRFQNKYNMIVYLEEEQEIAVLNSLKYTISKGGKPIEDMVNRELKAVKNTQSLQSVYDHLSIWWDYSDRAIDGVIKEMFKDELSKRKEAKEKNASASASANAYTDSVNDSYHDSLEQQSQKRYADDSQYMKAAVYLFEKIKERLPNKKEPDFQKWADEVRKTVELDGVPIERYKQVLDWSQNDDFWQANILSTNKLRKQFDTIYLQMQRDNKQNAPKVNDSWDYRKELYGE